MENYYCKEHQFSTVKVREKCEECLERKRKMTTPYVVPIRIASSPRRHAKNKRHSQ